MHKYSDIFPRVSVESFGGKSVFTPPLPKQLIVSALAHLCVSGILQWKKKLSLAVLLYLSILQQVFIKYCGAPPNICGVPKDILGVPKITFGVPKKLFGVPKSAFGVPKDIFGVPVKLFGVPKNIFGVPKNIQNIINSV